MQLKKNSSEKKLRGAYYTPSQLASFMVKLTTKKPYTTVLEPSCGDGVFLDCLYDQDLVNNNTRITAVEIEPPEAQKVANKHPNDDRLQVVCEDFLISTGKIVMKDMI